MNRATILTTLDPPWTGMQPVRLARAAAGRGTADRFVTVESDNAPLLRLDLHQSGDESFAFEEVCFWSGFVVIGWGHCVHLVEPRTRSVSSLDLGSYFGQLHPTETCLLVASAERLFRVEPDGAIRWKSDVLGINGVVVHHVENAVVQGSGEWDPPGGRQPFQLSLNSGQRV